MAKEKSPQSAKGLKPIPFGMVALCDYATKGENNKHTLVNVFSGDVLVPTFPATLQFGFYVELRPDEGFPENVELLVHLDGEKIAAVAVQFQNLSRTRPAVVIIPAMGLELKKAAEIKFSASAEGYSPTVLLTKKILLGGLATSPPTASPLPSLQSPSDASRSEPSHEPRPLSRRGRPRALKSPK